MGEVTSNMPKVFATTAAAAAVSSSGISSAGDLVTDSSQDYTGSSVGLGFGGAATASVGSEGWANNVLAQLLAVPTTPNSTRADSAQAPMDFGTFHHHFTQQHQLHHHQLHQLQQPPKQRPQHPLLSHQQHHHYLLDQPMSSRAPAPSDRRVPATPMVNSFFSGHATASRSVGGQPHPPVSADLPSLNATQQGATPQGTSGVHAEASLLAMLLQDPVAAAAYIAALMTLYSPSSAPNGRDATATAAAVSAAAKDGSEEAPHQLGHAARQQWNYHPTTCASGIMAGYPSRSHAHGNSQLGHNNNSSEVYAHLRALVGTSLQGAQALLPSAGRDNPAPSYPHAENGVASARPNPQQYAPAYMYNTNSMQSQDPFRQGNMPTFDDDKSGNDGATGGSGSLSDNASMIQLGSLGNLPPLRAPPGGGRHQPDSTMSSSFNSYLTEM
jgi:hypothetical protein